MSVSVGDMVKPAYSKQGIWREVVLIRNGEALLIWEMRTGRMGSRWVLIEALERFWEVRKDG